MKKLVMISASILVLTGCDAVGKTKPSTTNERNRKVTQQITTASGLKYITTKPGSGASPKKGQNVTVQYTGWLADNKGEPTTQFDSSKDRGPFTFTIGMGHVIKGWDEGVATMKVGEKRRLIIPSNLGYGARGAGRLIPPHATLIFDVELLGIS